MKKQLICIMLSILMVLSFVPGAAFAAESQNTSADKTAEESQSQEQTEEPEEPAGNFTKEARVEGILLSCKSKFSKVHFLPEAARPTALTFKAKRSNKIRLKWSASSGTDGYIIFRRVDAKKDGKGKWSEIARTAKTSYIDKSRKKNNRFYMYAVAGFRKNADGTLTISGIDVVKGVTYKNKLNNPYKPAISKKKASMEVGDTLKLTVDFSKYKPNASKWIRWRTDKPSVVRLDEGNVTAVAPGKVTVYARTANGNDVKCTIRVRQAEPPATPKPYIDYNGKKNRMTLCWKPVSGADGYFIYKVASDGTCTKVANVKNPTKPLKGLKKGKTYTFCVAAYKKVFSDNLVSGNSAEITQKYQPALRTKVKGIKKTLKKRSRKNLSVRVTVSAPAGRTAYIEMYKNNKWVRKGKKKLPNTLESRRVKLTFPDDWWTAESSTWRIRIPANDYARKYTSRKITVRSIRYYQNPGNMIQLSNHPSYHGQSFYMSPCRVNNASTRSDHVEAMISRAYNYLGNPYVVCRSGPVGPGVDCSGLVMQAGYAAGVDFYPSTPYRHTFPAYEYESREMWKLSTLKYVSWGSRQRGDLIFYCNNSGTVMHVAIYLGNDRIIHSWPGGVRVSNVYGWGNIKGARRIFN